MLFTSYEFLLFLAIVVVLYYVVPKKAQWIFLLIASYVFYYIASPMYLIYIALTTVSVWGTAVWIQKKKICFAQTFSVEKAQLDRQQRKAVKAEEKRKERRILLLGVLFNIGILAVTKYTNFMISNINTLLRLSGSGGSISAVDMLVPMGISFYTFQSVSYLIDVYREKYEAERNLFKIALFISFFPQLIQGPISRFEDLSKQLFKPHKAEIKTLSYGMQRILWGFFKKLVIADRVMVAVLTMTQDTQHYRGAFVPVAMLLYFLELYADFSGGIDITIGVAQMLDITVTENFQRPLFSKKYQRILEPLAYHDGFMVYGLYFLSAVCQWTGHEAGQVF